MNDAFYPGYIRNAKVGYVQEGFATWFTSEDKGGRVHTSMRSNIICPTCRGLAKGGTPCGRCGNDGELTNLFVYNPQGMFCAFPDSTAKLMGFRRGQLFRVTSDWGIALVNYVEVGPKERNVIIDLSPAAFLRVCPFNLDRGKTKVKVEELKL